MKREKEAKNIFLIGRKNILGVCSECLDCFHEKMDNLNDPENFEKKIIKILEIFSSSWGDRNLGQTPKGN